MLRIPTIKTFTIFIKRWLKVHGKLTLQLKEFRQTQLSIFVGNIAGVPVPHKSFNANFSAKFVIIVA